MKLNVLCFLMFLCLTNTFYSQEIKPIIYNPAIEYTQEMVDTILVYTRKNARKIQDYSGVKKILSSNKELSGWPYYYFFKAKELNLSKMYDSSVIYADKGIEYYKNSRNKRDFDEQILLETNIYKARSLKFLNRFEEAIVCNQKALNYSKKYPYKWKSYIGIGIADNHVAIGNDSVALEYYIEASKDSLYMSMARPVVTTYTRIGEIYSKLNDVENARFFLKKAIKFSNESDYTQNLWFLYHNVGDIYKEEKNKDSTLLYYKKAIEHYDENVASLTPTLYLLKYLKGYIELYEGDVNKSIDYFSEIVAHYDEIPKSKEEKDLLMNVYSTQGDAYEKKGDLTSLKEITVESNLFLEEFYENQLKTNLDNLEIKYKSKEKDISIASLEETTQSQEIIIKQRNTINWILGGLLLSFIGLGYLFYRQRRLQNQYKTSNLEQRLLRSQLNPHFLFNALNSVSGLVQKKSDQTIPYISKLGELLRSILENSREEFISLEEELETITTYLELQSNFSKKFAFNIEVDDSLDQEELLIPPMFLQPFIENAIDHGFNGNEDEKIAITVTQKQKGQVLYFSVEDNGIGYSNAMKNKKDMLGHQSLSGTILKERLDLYARVFKKKARYVIGDVDAGRGTRVELWLPYLIEAS